MGCIDGVAMQPENNGRKPKFWDWYAWNWSAPIDTDWLGAGCDREIRGCMTGCIIWLITAILTSLVLLYAIWRMRNG